MSKSHNQNDSFIIANDNSHGYSILGFTLTKYENIFSYTFFLLATSKYSYDTIFRLMSARNEEPKT
jgi:hypothetical protein